MHNISCCFILGFVLLFSGWKVESPEQLGEAVFHIMKSGDTEKLGQFNMTKEDFQNFTDEAKESELSKKNLDDFYSNWDKMRSSFFEEFDYRVNDRYELDPSKFRLGKITYDYILPDSDRDKLIMWPSSRSFKVKKRTGTTIADINVFFSDLTSHYRLSLVAINVKGAWKFGPKVGKFKLKRID